MYSEVRLWVNYVKKSEGLQKEYYGNYDHIHRNHRGWINSVENFPRVKNLEVFYNVISNSEGSRVTLIPEKNNLSWMMDLLGKFTIPAKFAVGCVSDTIFVSKYYL